jgi:ADP-dependent NAD(P)H-hydrate dehydratase / NAD(P)H-hydrate epimerase
MKVCSTSQMREIDRRAQQEFGISGDELMAEAGRAAAVVVLERFHPARVCIVCGKGNNAGDGYVVARHLKSAGSVVDVACIGSPEELKGSAANAYRSMQGHSVNELTLEHLQDSLDRCNVVVDALLGTGARGAASGAIADAIRAVNASGKPVVSIDVPSGGRDLAPGEALGEVVRASLTVTIGIPKTILLTMPLWPFVGELCVVRINFPDELLEDPSLEADYYPPADLRTWLPARPPDANKGTFGKVGIVAGSVQFAGAGILAARAALRAGCGLVTIFASADVNAIYKSALPEAVTCLVPSRTGGRMDDTSADAIVEMAGGFDSLAIGPGLGTTDLQSELVVRVVTGFQRPIVLDADALTCLARGGLSALRRRRDCVLTPHPGEMSRLSGRSVPEIQADRIGAARTFAAGHGVCLLLKGAGTVVARPSGEVTIVPGTCTALAKGGTGDVLTGMIASFAAQGMEVWKAAVLAAHLHLDAGRRCAQRIGERSVLAGEVADAVAASLREL